MYLLPGNGGEAVLCHLVFGNPVVLFKVLQDVNLLACHLPAILLVLGRCYTFTR